MKPDEISLLTTEGFNPATAEIDTMDPLSIVRLINEQDAQVAKAVAVELPHVAAAVDAISAKAEELGLE